ncbi:YbaN family protein [Clostridium cylindrosporum]|uniref:Inner membrane protein YbaN n=1 Tax=Clostridium cylindrosporum DSM 605 TaxID=1121307 RepID=A0A0J8DAX5_CLOCY|nr:YbaN family protein [Clostridium cylindrosporum]KMT23205.1 hypothetical protein CLCY_6c00860 [Clostridium cylindrosporum DSM 605]
MSRFKKIIYVTVGIISLILGFIGIVLPILPTTPFLLLSSFCFVRGSEKINIWFKGSKIYKKHLEEFIREKSMTLKRKIIILIFADTMIIVSMLLVNKPVVTLILLLVIIVKLYYFIFKIKTIKLENN